ncbi:hypothetical protein [Neobacillus terrae]|uniref:hypothetical protein n=1 Tax=Neobacillus terrae TaxID=3034837 RepID=UPI00140CC285|nr:hypothetical protein [Neobacillus terrae]NHM30007.1 hypothetical protein [Neobacillus terrae]
MPIHPVIPKVDAQLFEKTKEFIYNCFENLSEDALLTKGRIRIQYQKEGCVVNLIPEAFILII